MQVPAISILTPPDVLAVIKCSSTRASQKGRTLRADLEGRAQWLEEVCLLEQLFVMDGSQRIQDVLLQASQAARMPLAITGFVRLQVHSSPCRLSLR